MHSPADIDNGLLAFARAQPTGEHNNAYFGMVVKKTCSTCTGGYKLYHYVIRLNGTYTDAVTTFSDEQHALLILDYEKKYANFTDLSSTYGTMYMDGNGRITDEGLEKLFFDTLGKMGLSDKVILQRIDEKDGAITINNITINSDGTHTTAVPCP